MSDLFIQYFLRGSGMMEDETGKIVPSQDPLKGVRLLEHFYGIRGYNNCLGEYLFRNEKNSTDPLAVEIGNGVVLDSKDNWRRIDSPEDRKPKRRTRKSNVR